MTPTTVGIHQPQYLPYLGFFHKVANSDLFVLLDDVQFQKGGFQNRNRIKTNQGWQWITVPVLQGSKQLISDVKINQSVPWQRKHWTALKTNYARAPFFDHLAATLEQTLMSPWEDLTHLNGALVSWALKELGVNTSIVTSSSLKLSSKGTERLVDICRLFGASRYLSGPGGRNYMDLEAFSDAEIEVVWQEFSSPEYNQLYSEVGFQADLSIVDALFCCGTDARRFLD